MTDIRALPDRDDALLGCLIAGYTSTEVYRVAREETPDTAEIQRYRNNVSRTFQWMKRQSRIETSSFQAIAPDGLTETVTVSPDVEGYSVCVPFSSGFPEQGAVSSVWP